MEILDLELKHYGRFENHSIRLKPGINIIYGGNETGKTTIHSFIRAMLFGLNRGRGKAARTDEYQIRQPWNTPGAFLGSMRIAENGEVYRIDRCFDRSARPLQVVCETRSQEVSQPERLLEELLGGMTEQTFVNSVFIAQAKCETDESLAQELRKYMLNCGSTMDAELDVSRALQNLRKKKKQFEQKKKKEEEALEAQIAGKQARAEALRSELELLKRQTAQSSAAGNRNAARQGRHSEELYRTDGAEERPDHSSSRMRIILEALLLLAGAAALAGAVFSGNAGLRAYLGVFGALFLLMMAAVHFLLGREENEEWEQEDAADAMRPQEDAYFSEEIRKREDAYRKLKEELEELYGRHIRADGNDTEIAALTMAIDRICDLTSGIFSESGGELNDRASDILAEITQGRYSRIVLDETAEVRIHTPSRVLGLHQVSGGTMQQIYFALRMAAGELLCNGKTLPVILDETFAMYDDERLESVLRWLRNSGRQVILFTCQKREREILHRIQER